jgi:glycine cleavage system H protein
VTKSQRCHLPETLHYWIDKHVWVRDEGAGIVTLGITDPAQHLSSRVVAITVKKTGKVVARGQSVATIESGKWVGPVATPLDGEILEANAALAADPTLVNSDPYGEGWVVRLRPSQWDVQRAELRSGPEGIEAYRRFLDEQGITCG